MTLILLIFSSVLVSCNKDSENIDYNSEKVEIRKCKKCWGAVAADFGGLASGVSTGAWWGGLLGPNGAVIGGMLGGVVGTVYEGYTYGSKAGLIVTYEDTQVPMAPQNDNTENNPYDYIGVLHNTLLNKYLKSYSSFPSNTQMYENILEEMFADALNELNDTEEFINNFDNFDLDQFKELFIKDFLSGYNNVEANQDVLDIINEFIEEDVQNQEDLESFIRAKLTNDLSKDQLMGIAVLRYSYYYWFNI